MFQFFLVRFFFWILPPLELNIYGVIFFYVIHLFLYYVAICRDVLLLLVTIPFDRIRLATDIVIVV